MQRAFLGVLADAERLARTNLPREISCASREARGLHPWGAHRVGTGLQPACAQPLVCQLARRCPCNPLNPQLASS